ncbi:protease HtpX homolog [Striga asiatica]|uniref:Protease HtpX homolog n=1 Tax=Striga asiatica TaxID=4170 RepID=A0A5A7PN37_STRAF|nr:protease HtpX homolog [Striga asiatica]
MEAPDNTVALRVSCIVERRVERLDKPCCIPIAKVLLIAFELTDSFPLGRNGTNPIVAKALGFRPDTQEGTCKRTLPLKILPLRITSSPAGMASPPLKVAGMFQREAI